MANDEFQERLEKATSAVKNILYGGSATGVAGAAWGACLATIRNESAKFYAASMGANFFLVSSTFIAMEEIIADMIGRRDMMTGATAGGITGGFFATIVGGRLRGIQGSAAGVVSGAALHYVRQEFEKWRLTQAVERYEEKYGKAAPVVYYPNTDILVETKGPARDLVFPSLLPSSIKVTEEEIEMRIQARVEELRRESMDDKSKP